MHPSLGSAVGKGKGEKEGGYGYVENVTGTKGKKKAGWYLGVEEKDGLFAKRGKAHARNLEGKGNGDKNKRGEREERGERESFLNE